jgi:dTMP kinase
LSLFITIEGPDGSGKSTQATLLVDTLRDRGLPVVATREPGGTALGDRIRELILDPDGPAPTPRAMALLYSASRAQLVETVIRPALARGEIVVADRYADSTIAYQGFGLGLPAGEIRTITAFATGGLKPNLTIYVDIDPGRGLERTANRGRQDRLDAQNLDFHRRVREAYRALMRAEPERWVCVDGSVSPEAVQTAIMEAIEPRLDGWAGP